jgi:hypothetical protein
VATQLIDVNRIERQRDVIYRRSRTRRIRSMDEAARFINAVGFSLLFASTQNLELPSLFEAVKGRRDAHIEDWDKDSDRVWVWKNDLPADKLAYYGKALAGGKPAFVALEMLPALYAVNAPDSENSAYQRGQISYEAKRIYDALRDLGPTPTTALRAAAGFDRDTARYHHALDELQRILAVLPVGATMGQSAWSSQIFDLTERWFKSQVMRAQKLDVAQARRVIVKRYVETVIACTPAMIARVFGWQREAVIATVNELVARRGLSRTDEWIVRHVE